VGSHSRHRFPRDAPSGSIKCGNCPIGQTCLNNRECVEADPECTKAVACTKANCGPEDDGCGSIVDCERSTQGSGAREHGRGALQQSQSSRCIYIHGMHGNNVVTRVLSVVGGTHDCCSVASGPSAAAAVELRASSTAPAATSGQSLALHPLARWHLPQRTALLCRQLQLRPSDLAAHHGSDQLCWRRVRQRADRRRQRFYVPWDLQRGPEVCRQQVH
jgi:hypothetical protein